MTKITHSKIVHMKPWGNTQGVIITQEILKGAGILNLYGDYAVTTDDEEHTITLRKVKSKKKVVKTVRILKRDKDKFKQEK